jgi:transcriptional regulator with XRE-family HTH domain
MRINQVMTNDAVLAELGARVAVWRLERGLTQEQLAARAGIGRATLQRLEAGGSVQLTSVVKLLRAFGMLDALDVALPEGVGSMIAELERVEHQRPRQRAPRQHRARATGGGSWQWGDGSWKWADGDADATPGSL